MIHYLFALIIFFSYKTYSSSTQENSVNSSLTQQESTDLSKIKEFFGDYRNNAFQAALLSCLGVNKNNAKTTPKLDNPIEQHILEQVKSIISTNENLIAENKKLLDQNNRNKESIENFRKKNELLQEAFNNKNKEYSDLMKHLKTT